MTPQSLPEVHGRSDFKMQLVEMSPFYGSYIRATRCLHHDVIAFEYRHFREIQALCIANPSNANQSIEFLSVFIDIFNDILNIYTLSLRFETRQTENYRQSQPGQYFIFHDCNRC